jgi:hypothetical protein
MEDLGLSISDVDTSNIDAIGDAFEGASSVIEASFQKALSALAPYLISFARTVEQVVGYIVKNWDSILPVLKLIGLALAALAIYFSPILVGIALVAAAILKWPKVFGAVSQYILDILEKYVLQPLKAIVREIYAVGAGMVRWNSNQQCLEINDGISWQQLRMSSPIINLSADTIEVLEWAKQRMAREHKWQQLAKDNPAIAPALENYNQALAALEMLGVLVD